MPPCLDCPDREVGCHSKCEKYIKFRADLDQHKAEIEKNLRADKMVEAFQAQQCLKVKRLK
jgi:hypothetical protein